MAIQITPKAFSELMKQTLPQIVADFRKAFVLPANKSLTMGKTIVAMDKKREGKESLRAFMAREFGTIDSNAYKPAKVFRVLVAVNDAGEAMDKAPAGKITEEAFDRFTIITGHIMASSILGLIEKQAEKDKSVADRFTQDLARIISEHKNNEETMAKLKALKDIATPEKDGEGEGEGEGEGSDAEKAVSLTPLAILSLLQGERSKEIWRAIMEHAKENPQCASEIAHQCQNISANAAKVATVVSSFVPVSEEKAAA
jgi:hypothetical protein